MSALTHYVSISFSQHLSQEDSGRKKEALLNLKNFLERRPDINTGDSDYYPISYATAPYFDGTIDLAGVFKARIINAELSHSEQLEVAQLGFTTRIVGPHAFSFYAHDKT